MTSSIVFIIIFCSFYVSLIYNSKNKNNNAESLRNCAEKTKIGFLGESLILEVTLWPKKWRHRQKWKLRLLSATILKKKTTCNTHSRKISFFALKALDYRGICECTEGDVETSRRWLVEEWISGVGAGVAAASPGKFFWAKFGQILRKFGQKWLRFGQNQNIASPKALALLRLWSG